MLKKVNKIDLSILNIVRLRTIVLVSPSKILLDQFFVLRPRSYLYFEAEVIFMPCSKIDRK